MSNNENARFKAAVPLFTAMHEFDFIYFLNSFSNFDTCPEPEPEAQNLLSRTFTRAFFSEESTTGSNYFINFDILISFQFFKFIIFF